MSLRGLQEEVWSLEFGVGSGAIKVQLGEVPRLRGFEHSDLPDALADSRSDDEGPYKTLHEDFGLVWEAVSRKGAKVVVLMSAKAVEARKGDCG